MTRVVLITGGSRGLGEGFVGAFLAAGDTVVTCSRSVTPAVEAWSGDPALAGRFHHACVDLVDRDACRAFVDDVLERFGTIDVLVNNAGVAHDGVLALARDEDVDAVLDLNVKATITMTRLVVRRMLLARSGRIINVSSIVGLSGYRGLSVYSATKAALDGFTRSLARELGSRGITVNSIAPGYLRTDMSHGLDEAQLGQIARRTPVGRLGEPNDIASVALFLASDGARFLTGQTLVVDGGLTA
ncbi:MAG: SDR family NAD(P)-dependent oxidoreductase [Solirubrobacteraceae bacterium]